ncbi:MAG: fasciclin domain-containing protein [Bacteroidetes bacterium]|nr:fasciclin domain-containing protein [Bacteroidota bacterium]
MKKYLFIMLLATAAFVATSCNQEVKSENNETETTTSTDQAGSKSIADVKDDGSQKNVVQVAVGSKDHTTLVKAVQAADLVTSLANQGPFTVFAPVNAAFDKLPKGTVEDLLKPENKAKLADILQYHVCVSSFKVENLHDGQNLGMVNGGNAKITVKDGKTYINGSQILASVPASNGIVHVIGDVLLPPSK